MTLAWLFERAKQEEVVLADRVLRELANGKVVVPGLWHTEVLNGVLVAERRRVVSEAQGSDFLTRLAGLPIRTDEAPVADRRKSVRGLARQYSLTAYDASYLELALREGAVLASFDGALVTAMQRAGGVVAGDAASKLA